MIEIAEKHATGSAIAGVTIEKVAFDAPWSWLAAGWRDMWAAPRISISYGVAFALMSMGLTAGLMVAGLQSLILALAGGFLLIGPIAAVGLYETSRRLESGQAMAFGDVVRAGLNAPGQLGFFGAILAFLYLAWLQIAFLLFMLFLGSNGLPPASEFVPTLLFTARGLGLLVVGTAAGCLLALAAFAISAISVPLLMTRRADAMTAIAASVTAVLVNPKPLALWAAIIAGCMILGIATLYAGLILAFPLIGHATWHAYRDLVRESHVSYL
jgi:uncharacterized membrane protein